MLLGGIAMTLASCVATSEELPEVRVGPTVPPPGTGSGSGVPVSIELVPPNRPMVIASSQFATARAVADAESKHRKLGAELRREGRLDRQEEVRALEAKTRQGLDLNQGIHLTLRVTNISRDPIALPFGPDSSVHILHLEGPGAFFIPYHGAVRAILKVPPVTVIEPGASKKFPIRNLGSGNRELARWLIGSPGVYTTRLQFKGRIYMLEGDLSDVTERVRSAEFGLASSAKGKSIDVTSNEVTFEVKAGQP
jgi:hypothetical protein